jgi:hypothetical protein
VAYLGICLEGLRIITVMIADVPAGIRTEE